MCRLRFLLLVVGVVLGGAGTASATTWKFDTPAPPGLQSRIVNGTPSNAVIPWQVALVRAKDGGVDVPLQVYCGGTLRDSTHVVTAAHCLPDDPGDDPAEIAVIVGLYRTSDPALSGAVPKSVTKITSHPSYSSTAEGFDAAVLTLGSPVTAPATVAPRPVAAANAGSFVNDVAMISGWGTTSSGGSSPDDLQFTTINVYPDSNCGGYQEAFQTQTMVCAGFNDGTFVYDTCQGDSGGPLMRYDGSGSTFSDFTTLIGIVSFGRGCAEAEFPGVYTRVTEPSINALITQADPPARVSRGGDPTISGAAGVISCTPATWGNGPTAVDPKILLLTGTVQPNQQGGNTLNVTAVEEVAGRSYTVKAADSAKFAQCEERAVNAGGALEQTSGILRVADAGTAPPPTPPAPAPTPPPVVTPPAASDLLPPTSRVTRRSCSRRTKVCSLTIMLGDTGGSDLARARVRATVTQLSGCPRAGRTKRSKARARTCRKPRTVTAGRSSTGLYTLKTARLRKGRVRISVRATDAAGNTQLKATSVTLRVS